MDKTAMKLRGVNLGSWLVLEKWMVPSLFEGLQATDETTWCAEMGPLAAERLRAHWDSFITREDFRWIAGHGLNAVRIPVGHWIFGPDYPYHPKYGDNRHPFVTGGIEVIGLDVVRRHVPARFVEHLDGVQRRMVAVAFGQAFEHR